MKTYTVPLCPPGSELPYPVHLQPGDAMCVTFSHGRQQTACSWSYKFYTTEEMTILWDYWKEEPDGSQADDATQEVQQVSDPEAAD